jgi:hypothetical protein
MIDAVIIIVGVLCRDAGSGDRHADCNDAVLGCQSCSMLGCTGSRGSGSGTVARSALGSANGKANGSGFRLRGKFGGSGIRPNLRRSGSAHISAIIIL